MLEQLGKHSKSDLNITVKGDLHIVEHHTIEDTALTLGQAFLEALEDKKKIERCLEDIKDRFSPNNNFGERYIYNK